jgi:hypothetical protein
MTRLPLFPECKNFLDEAVALVQYAKVYLISASGAYPTHKH